MENTNEAQMSAGKELNTLKRRISYERYLLAVSITILFFIAGMMAGLYIAEKKIDKLGVSSKAIAALLELSELKDELIKNKTKSYCNLSWDDVWKEKVEIGSILTSLENRLGKENKKVIEQKLVYSKVQIKTLNLVEQINSECGYNWTIIIFFYTNDKNDKKGDVKVSEFQGYALDTLYNENKEQIKIFAIDINLNEGATQNLVERYEVKEVPAVVINGKVYREFLSGERITRILREK